MNLRYCYLTEGARPDVVCVFGHRPDPRSAVERSLHCRVERARTNAKSWDAMGAVRRVEKRLRLQAERQQQVIDSCLREKAMVA